MRFLQARFGRKMHRNSPKKAKHFKMHKKCHFAPTRATPPIKCKFSSLNLRLGLLSQSWADLGENWLALAKS